jgi:hypothetical protein
MCSRPDRSPAESARRVGDPLGAPRRWWNVAEILREFPEVVAGIGDDGLAKPPRLVAGRIDEVTALADRALSGGIATSTIATSTTSPPSSSLSCHAVWLATPQARQLWMADSPGLWRAPPRCPIKVLIVQHPVQAEQCQVPSATDADGPDRTPAVHQSVDDLGQCAGRGDRWRTTEERGTRAPSPT